MIQEPTVQKSTLLRALQEEIRRHSQDCFCIEEQILTGVGLLMEGVGDVTILRLRIPVRLLRARPARIR